MSVIGPRPQLVRDMVFMTDEQRIRHTAYIYLDAEIAPFMKATVVHFFYDVVDKFVIYNDTLCICIATIDHEICNIAFSYHFSRIDTAEERLYYLNLVRRYISSERVFIKMCNHEQYNLSFATALPCEEWEQNVRKTEYWMSYTFPQ